MLFRSLLLVLALYRAAEYWRMSAKFKGFLLVKVVIQDQVVYFFLSVNSYSLRKSPLRADHLCRVLVCATVNIIEFRVYDSASDSVVILLQSIGNTSFLCILGSRLLVNLKEAGELGLNEGTNYRPASQSTSSMVFAVGNAEG